MKRFYFRENKDSGNDYLSALLGAGYERIADQNSKAPESGYEKNCHILDRADFMVLDHDYTYKPTPEWERYFTPEAMERRPVFIYPHVPYSWFIWDGIIEAKAVACNFVVSEGAKEAMQLFGYPRRVEVTGFPGMAVKAFSATQGTKLLFAPAHPVHDGKYPQREGFTRIRDAAEKIIRNIDKFESVTVRYSNTLEACGLDAFKRVSKRFQRKVIFEPVNVYTTSKIRQSALESIRRADLVISQSSFGYLAVAEGKPTVFYGYRNVIPFSREGYVKNYPLYKHIFQYPLVFESMPIQDILDARKENSAVENWKRLNIGDNFCKEKFLSVIREYV
jgi:hypothetical protein